MSSLARHSLASTPRSAHPSPSLFTAFNEDTALHDFEGDFFGQYSPHDWDDYDEYQGDEHDGGGEQSQPTVKDKHHSSPDDVEDDLAEDGNEEADEADNFEDEGGWEPCARPGPDEDTLDQAYDDDPGDTAEHHEAQKRTQQHVHSKTFSVPFPGVHAGAPINQDNH